MKRRTIFALLSLIFLGSFVSAYYGGGFSFQNLFSNTSPSLVFSLLFFLILFVFFNYSLSRVFVENQTVPKVISLSLSTGVVYWMNISNSIPNSNLGSFFSNVGLSGNFLSILVPLLFLGILVYLIFKLKRTFFLLFGILFFILGLFDVIYESGASIILGIVFLLVWLYRRKHRFGNPDFESSPRKTFFRLSPRETSSRPSSRKIYRRELKDRRYQEKNRQAEIRARAKNIKEIGDERDKAKNIKEIGDERDKAREQKQLQERSIKLKSLIREYNKIQMRDPKDPRLRKIVEEVKEIKRKRS